MSNDIDIRVEGLGKRYHLGQTVDLSRTFREALMSLPSHFSRRAREALQKTARAEAESETPHDTFWALRDVSFEARRGEVIGIIGRNGAGKSTLLKILSRVTSPTKGQVEIRGRVGALLEVGTGFHPELSGRENVYLNGAILGMRRAEIDRKFDEIVAFAEVEQFLDTPVKRYSSGMRVRLGFAVAAHLDPEILIVDEVLSVGDAEFRKKCLGKMGDVSRQGRTVLFISHNMASIRNLCPRAILLDHGRIVEDGSSAEVIAAYLGESAEGASERRWSPGQGRVPGSEWLQLISARLAEPATGETQSTFETSEPIDFEVTYRVLKTQQIAVQFQVKDAEGAVIFWAGDFQDMRWQETRREPGEYRVVCHLPGNFFNPGAHYIDMSIVTYSPHTVHCMEMEMLAFRVEDDFRAGGSRGFNLRAEWPPSVVRPKFDYDVYRDGVRL